MMASIHLSIHLASTDTGTGATTGPNLQVLVGVFSRLPRTRMAQDRPRASIDGEMQGIEADLLLEATAYACFGERRDACSIHLITRNC